MINKKKLNFSYYIAKRYLFSKNSNNAINMITLIASFGVIVGSMALFIILSGFSGLRTFSNSLLEISDPDIKISSVTGKSFVYEDALENILIENFKIIAFSKTLEERVFLTYKDKQQIAYIKGVDVNYSSVTKIDSSLYVGTWLSPEYKNTAVIGNGISYKLSLGILNFGEALEIAVPKSGTGFLNPANFLRKVSTQIVGVYSGTQEFENKYVFVDLLLAQELLTYAENEISAVELKIDINTDVDFLAAQLQEELGSKYNVQTKAQLNALFYRVINTENFVSYLIFTLILIIAMFNIVGAIIMMIIDKKENLKTLLNLGTTIKDIKKIFVLQGFLLTIFGMFIGLVSAVLLVFLQQKFGLFMLTQNLPYPVEFHFSNLFIVITTITILGFIAAKIASSRISVKFIGK
jgi:lipoprotein-releasing system permease protein